MDGNCFAGYPALESRAIFGRPPGRAFFMRWDVVLYALRGSSIYHFDFSGSAAYFFFFVFFGAVL